MSNGRDPYNQQPYNPYDQYNESYTDMSQRPSFPASGAEIKVQGLWFVPTGTYQDQYRRPWTAEVNQGNVNAIYDAVGQAYSEFAAKKNSGSVSPDAKYMIDPDTLAHVSSSFIKPAAAGEAPARLNLAYGLQYQTARFFMILTVMHHGAVEPTEYIINGYTNHLGLQKKAMRTGDNSEDYVPDHQMDMTVNNIMEVRYVERDLGDGYGLVKRKEMVNVDQVLVDTMYSDVDNAQVIRMRPYEVAASLSRMHDPEVNRTGVTATDTRYIQNAVPEFSDAHNSDPNEYMTKIITGLANGRDEAYQRNQNGILAPFTAAIRNVRDRGARFDPFLKALANYRDGVVSATFKFRDLLILDPNAEHPAIMKVQFRDISKYANQRGENMNIRDDSSPWHGQDLPTQWAAQIANQLPPMMMDLGIRSIDFLAINTRGDLICEPTHPWPFISGVNILPQLHALKSMFYHRFLMPMSEGNRISFDIDIQANLYGDIVIKLSVGGSPVYTYVYPAFMGASMSPVLTTQPDVLDDVAKAFFNLQKEVIPAQRPLVTELVGSVPSGKRY